MWDHQSRGGKFMRLKPSPICLLSTTHTTVGFKKPARKAENNFTKNHPFHTYENTKPKVRFTPLKGILFPFINRWGQLGIDKQDEIPSSTTEQLQREPLHLGPILQLISKARDLMRIMDERLQSSRFVTPFWLPPATSSRPGNKVLIVASGQMRVISKTRRMFCQSALKRSGGIARSGTKIHVESDMNIEGDVISHQGQTTKS